MCLHLTVMEDSFMKLSYGRRIHSVISHCDPKPNMSVAPWPQWRSCFGCSGSVGEPFKSPLVACYLHTHCYFSLEVLLFQLRVGYKKSHLQGLSHCCSLTGRRRGSLDSLTPTGCGLQSGNGNGGSHKTLLFTVSLPTALATLIPSPRHRELALSRAREWLQSMTREWPFMETHLFYGMQTSPCSPSKHDGSGFKRALCSVHLLIRVPRGHEIFL